jgi:hypothetical protein
MATYFFCANRSSRVLNPQKATFKELIKQFSVPELSQSKDGTGIFPGNYTLPVREMQYIDYHNLVILDIDKHQESQKLLNFLELNPFEYNYALYSTFSSRDDNLRVRFIVEATSEEIQIDDYAAAARTIERDLGVIVDPFSYKRNSFVYTPRIQPSIHYVFRYNLKGRSFGSSDIDPAFYVSSSAKEDFIDFSDPTRNHSDDPEYIERHVLEAMISAIPADDYDIWLRVMAGMHHYSGGALWGFELINKWSATSNKYESPDDIWYKWDSFKQSTARPITIGTVIFLANQHNWQAKRSQLLATQIRKDIKARAPDFISELTAYEFADRISKLPLSKIVRTSLVEAVVEATCIAMGLKGKARSRIAAELEEKSQYGGAIQNLPDDERLKRTPQWMRNYVIVPNIANETRFAKVSCPIDPETGLVLFTPEHFNIENRAHKTNQSDDLAKLAIDTFMLPSVDKIKFAPHEPTIFLDHTGHKCLNSYVKDETYHFSTEKFSSFQTELVDHLDNFSQFFLPDEKQRRIFFNFLAWNVFNMGDKILWAPLIVTTEGHGKDTFMHIFESALGRHRRYYLKTDGFKFFDPAWTVFLEHRAFIYVNEIYAAAVHGRAKAEGIFNSIKDLITQSESIRISAKFQKDRTINQVTNYFFSSNSTTGFVFSPTERRLFILQPENYHSNYKNAKADANTSLEYIWKCLHQLGIGSTKRNKSESVRNQIRAAFLHFFHEYYTPDQRDEDFKPKGHAYKTPEFFEIAELNQDQNLDIINSIIADERIPYANEYFVAYSACQNDFIDRIKQFRTTGSALSLQVLLEKAGYTNIKNFPFQFKHTYDDGKVKLTWMGIDRTKIFISKEARAYIYENKELFTDKTLAETTKLLWEKYEKDQKIKDFQLDYTPEADDLNLELFQ